MLSRRDILVGLAAAATAITSAPRMARASGDVVEVAKTATCGCCSAWVEHLRSSGFTVNATDMAMGQLIRFKQQHGITAELSSCHTARIAGYTIEGHVPAADVRRLLAERPAAIGLAVPGMPLGSPGMEAGSTREAYDVLLVKPDGSTEVFTHYDEVR